MGLIFRLSARPAADFKEAGGLVSWLPGSSYFVHVGLYFVLGLLLLRLTTRWHARGPAATRSLYMAAAVAVAVLYGVTDEYHQTFVEGRDASGLDLLADGLGALFAAALWFVWTARRRSTWLVKQRSSG